MELRVMKHDEAGVAGDVGPGMVVSRRIAKLVDDEVVRATVMPPDEVVGPLGIVQIDVVPRAKRGNDFSGVGRDTRAGGGTWREPGDLLHADDYSGGRATGLDVRDGV
jgi:hypothetical protein